MILEDWTKVNNMLRYFLVVLWCIAAEAEAQIITVKDQVTLRPIEGVRLSNSSGEQIRYTNAHGEANISGLEGSRKIEIHYMGYVTQTLSYSELAAYPSLFLEPDQLALDEIVVSANRWEQNKQNLPAKISVIKAKEIAFQNPQTAADMLAVSNEVYIQKSQLGGGSPMIRGFSTNRVLLVVDGVRMNNAIFRSGNLQNVISLDPQAIQSAEIIFGPGSLIYGSDAIGGVMDFHTLDPALATKDSMLVKGNALTRYSSANGEMTVHADVNLGTRHWAFLSSASFTAFDDQRMGSYNGPEEYLRPEYAVRENGVDRIRPNPDPEVQVPTGYHQYNLMQKIRYTPNGKWNFHLDVHYSETSDIPRYDRLIRYRKGQLRSAEWFYGPQTWWMNRIAIEHQGSGNLYNNARLVLAHQLFKESRHERDFGSTIRDNFTEKVNAYSANLELDKSLTSDLNLYYGAEAVWNQVGSSAFAENIETGTRQAIGTRYPDGAQWNSYAVYTNLTAELTPRLTWNGGLRYNVVSLTASFDTTFYPFPFTESKLTTGALTMATGFSFRPTESWMMRLNLSTGFRAPNIDDIGKVFDSGDQQVVVPNPGLEAEKAYNIEWGIAKVIGNTVKLDASVFYTYLDDALVRRDFTLGGRDSLLYQGETSQVQAIQNASRAYVYGVQIGLDIKLPANLGVELNYNYQYGEEELADESTAPLRHAAPWFGGAHLIYTRKRFKVDSYVLINGEIGYERLAPSERSKPWIYATNAEGNPYAPSWYTLNLKTSYQFTDRLQVTAGVENITDQRYRPYSSGIVAPGINFIGAVRVTF